jgi:NAD(P)-dependent dehydrogenase (short-subunit alcohol dehydrogenase family)
MAEFTGKVALVTGGASGIGRAVAEMYAREGARVVVSDVDESAGQETVSGILTNGGEALFLRADVSDPEDCRALVEQTVERFGGLDMACNNAGIGGEANVTGEYSIKGWQRVIDINLNGVFYCMRYEIPAMLEKGGAIVNMASILGQVGFATAPAYVAAKHGIIGLTKTAGIEYAKFGVRVNAVGPAYIRTPLIEPMLEDKATNDLLVSLHPIGRLGTSAEVAELVQWLSSERASFATGAYYPIDGGYLAQ